MKLIVTVGPGFSPTPHGHLLLLDWQARKVVAEFSYAHRVYSQSHKGLTGASWYGERLLVATEAELLEFSVAPLRLIESRSFHFLNDVHHLAACGDRIWVCNTGLDCVEELDAAWQPVATHHLVKPFGRHWLQILETLRSDIRKSWNRLRGRYDFYSHLTERPVCPNVVKLVWQNAYRRNRRELRYCDFRPHVLHPNHVLPLEDDVWITLFRTGEIVSLRRGVTVARGLGHPHDGIVSGDELFVTDCQSNRLMVYQIDASKQTVGPCVAVRSITRHLSEGFLRGVVAVGDRVFVGLTARRGRPTNFESARIIALKRQSLEPVDEWIVPAKFGRQVFSILDAGQRFD